MIFLSDIFKVDKTNKIFKHIPFKNRDIIKKIKSNSNENFS